MEINFEFEKGNDPGSFSEALERFWSTLESSLVTIVQQGFNRIERSASRLAPVDTGNLRASIENVVETIAGDVIRGEAGTNVEYAEYVEMGTGSMAAQPFLRPAFDETIPWIMTAVRAAVRNAWRQA